MHSKKMEKNKPDSQNYSKQLAYYGIAIIIVWTIFIGFTLFWNLRQINLSMIEGARIEARSIVQTQFTYRHWNASHGGVYVEISPSTQPNPYFNDPEKNITTTSGRQLTLLTPAYMRRQVDELSFEKFGYISHATSLNPLRPENKPDQWEADALQAFKKNNINEIDDVEFIKNKEYLRLIRPLRAEASCLKCHGEQNYKSGDVIGGISVSVPLAHHFQVSLKSRYTTWIINLTLFLIGFLGTIFFLYKMNFHIKKRVQAEEALRQTSKLDGVIEMARAVCHKLNQPLQMVIGNTEILMMEGIDEETRLKRLGLIKDQVEEMGKMTRNIIRITTYKTIDLPQGKVIDIDESSK